jgi:hypothetical protein
MVKDIAVYTPNDNKKVMFDRAALVFKMAAWWCGMVTSLSDYLVRPKPSALTMIQAFGVFNSISTDFTAYR